MDHNDINSHEYKISYKSAINATREVLAADGAPGSSAEQLNHKGNRGGLSEGSAL